MIRLVCLDMDGVLAREWNFWLKLHEAWGTLEEGSELTRKYLRTDYPRLMRKILDPPDGIWIGKDQETFDELVKSTAYHEGIEEFFSELDKFEQGEHQYFSHEKRVPRAIISSGPYQLANRIKQEFGVDFIFGNELVFEDGIYKGKYHFHMMSGDKYKTDVLHQLCEDLDILPQHVLYVGDDKSDEHVFGEVGFSIAFGARDDALKKAATYVVNSQDLKDAIPVLREIRKVVA